MGLKCRISYRNGVTQVVDNNGNESQLYNELLSYTGNSKEALDLWIVANSEEFMGVGENATIKDITSFMDSAVASTERLSLSEKFQVIDFMKRTGEVSLDALNEKLIKIFKADGIFSIDIDEAVSSGIFTQQEIEELDPQQVQDILQKIEGQLIVEDILVEPEALAQDYVNSDIKTIFGTSQVVTQKEFDTDIINAVESFTDRDSFLRGIKTLPYSNFIQRFQDDDAFASSVMEKFSGLKRIPKLSIFEGELSSEENKVYTTVRNTILVNNKDVSIESEIRYLNSISKEIWDDNLDDIKTILKEVEKTLADINIDIVGISNIANNRLGVMQLLEDSATLLKNLSKESLRNFAATHNRIIKTDNTIIVEKLEDKYKGLNIVSFFSDKSADSIFKNYGLIQIGENLYHKVDQNASIDTVRDFIYDQFIEGTIQIPSEFILVKDSKNPNNKTSVIESISKYLMSRPTTNITNHELYSAYQVAFNHSPIENKEYTVSDLMSITTDEVYLKSGFISDFYNYILTEKVKDSVVYRNILSKFQINDKGISLTEVIPSIENLEYSEELKDYIKLNRDSSMRYLVEKKGTLMSEDLLYLNFPEKAKDFEGALIVDGNFVITNPTVDNFFRLRGDLYRKEIERDNANLFVKITPSVDNVYLTKNLDFSFDRKAANDLFNEYGMLSPTTISYNNFQEIIAKSRLNDNMLSEFKELSTLKDKSYTFTEAEGVISVYKDGKEVGSISYTNEEGAYNNPRVSLAEVHKGKGIGTELYLQLFDKAKKNGKVVNKPTEETPQSKSIFERVSNIADIKTEIDTVAIDKLLTAGEVTFVNDETGIPCLKAGANLGFTPGSKWKVVKKFKGNSHERGGIDITIGKDSIKMTSKEGDIKAKYGVVISSKTLK